MEYKNNYYFNDEAELWLSNAVRAGSRRALNYKKSKQQPFTRMEFVFGGSLLPTKKYSENGKYGGDCFTCKEKYDYSHIATMNYELVFLLGKKHLRFSIAPISFTHLGLPGFDKLDSSGLNIGKGKEYENYHGGGSAMFYSPSVGIQYVLYKEDLKDFDRNNVEFPIFAQISPSLLYMGKEGQFYQEGDTKFKDFFAKGIMTAKFGIGVNLHGWMKTFGFGAKIYGNYVGIKDTSEPITISDNTKKRETFNIRMNEVDKINLGAEIHFIFRL